MDPLEARVAALEKFIQDYPLTVEARIAALDQATKRVLRILPPMFVPDLVSTNAGGYNDLAGGPEFKDVEKGLWLFFFSCTVTTSAVAAPASVGQVSLALNGTAVAPDEAQCGMVLQGVNGIMQATVSRPVFAPLREESNNVRMQYGSVNGANVRFTNRMLFGFKIL